MKENRYTMPQQFMDDANVALKWKLYGYLNGFWVGGKTVYARNDTIAKEFGKSERAIQAALEELEKLGLITRDIKGLSRYILPGGIKEEGRSPASPQDEAQLRGGTKPSFTILQISNADSLSSALEDELRVEKESNSESPSRFKPAKYPHALEVFTWFPNPQPSWKAQKSVAEREYAEYLYKRGEEAVRGILAFCVQYGDMEFFPAWQCPSKLEKNWVAIQAFANRNGL